MCFGVFWEVACFYADNYNIGGFFRVCVFCWFLLSCLFCFVVFFGFFVNL